MEEVYEGSGNSFFVADVTQAVELANRFRNEGRFNWFRGQLCEWPICSPLARLDQAEQRPALERAGRFFRYLASTPQLKHLIDGAKVSDTAVAIAHHYGIPTSFVSFTTEPQVAGFFATAGGPPDNRTKSCIVCLDTEDLTEYCRMVWPIFEREAPMPETVTIDMTDLWSMQAQSTTFLFFPFRGFEKSDYRFARIYFPYTGPIEQPSNDEMYPMDKSPVEVLLDKYFRSERWIGLLKHALPSSIPDVFWCGLTQSQGTLIVDILNCSSQADVLALLTREKGIIDETLLSKLLYLSRDLVKRQQFDQASRVAASTLEFVDETDLELGSELLMVVGESLTVQEKLDEAEGVFNEVIQIEAQTGIVNLTPLATFNLAALYRRKGNVVQANRLYLDSIDSVQRRTRSTETLFVTDGGVEHSQNILVEMFRGYLQVTDDLGVDLEAAYERALSLVAGRNRKAVYRYLSQIPESPISEEQFDRHWIRAQARYRIEIEGVEKPQLMYYVVDLLKAQLVEQVGKPKRSGRPTTNMLVQRQMTNLPIIRPFTTMGTLTDDLESVSVLVHEFTHYASFGGGLGYYFALLTLGLLIAEAHMRTICELAGARGYESSFDALIQNSHLLKDHPISALAVNNYLVKAKLQLLWRMWYPWAEGLAVFAETELDLSESGEFFSFIAQFLFGLESEIDPAVFENEMPTESGASLRQAYGQRYENISGKIELAEGLQAEARKFRIETGYRADLWLGRLDRVYFVGAAVICALWQKWAQQYDGFRNSVWFLSVVIELTRSAFTDLLPDIGLDLQAFADQLVQRHTDFVNTLFSTDANTLEHIFRDRYDGLNSDTTETTGEDTRSLPRWDIWRYIRTGKEQDVEDAVLERGESVKKELYHQVYGTRIPYSFEAFGEHLDTLSSIYAGNTNLHLLSKSVVNVRLNRDLHHILLVGHTDVDGRKEQAILYMLQSAEEYQAFSDLAQRSNTSIGTLYQFILSKPDPVLDRIYEFPLLLELGGSYLPMPRLGHSIIEPPKLDVMEDFVKNEFTARQLLSDSLGRLDKELEELDQLFGKVGVADHENSERVLELALRILRGFDSRVEQVYLGGMIPRDKHPDSLAEFGENGLEVLLPDGYVEQYYGREVLRIVLGRMDGIPLGEVAQCLGEKEPSKVRELIERIISHSTQQWGQRPLVIKDDAVSFGYLEWLDAT